MAEGAEEERERNEKDKKKKGTENLLSAAALSAVAAATPAATVHPLLNALLLPLQASGDGTREREREREEGKGDEGLELGARPSLSRFAGLARPARSRLLCSPPDVALDRHTVSRRTVAREERQGPLRRSDCRRLLIFVRPPGATAGSSRETRTASVARVLPLGKGCGRERVGAERRAGRLHWGN